jgi:cobyrinic acid a,c-diamide synthase
MVPGKKNALSPELFNSALEYATWIVQNTQILKLNGKHLVLVSADDVNSMGKNINTIKKNTEAILATNKAVGLEENAEETMNKMKDNVKMHKCANIQRLWNSTNKPRLHA